MTLLSSAEHASLFRFNWFHSGQLFFFQADSQICMIFSTPAILDRWFTLPLGHNCCHYKSICLHFISLKTFYVCGSHVNRGNTLFWFRGRYTNPSERSLAHATLHFLYSALQPTVVNTSRNEASLALNRHSGCFLEKLTQIRQLCFNFCHGSSTHSPNMPQAQHLS